MPFCSVYTTNPPLLPPETINASSGTTTDGTASGNAPFAIELESVDGVDGEVKLSAGAATYRIYYWTPVNKTGFTNGGSWLPLGGDATSGAGPISANITNFGGGANGRYQHRSGKRWFLLVRETDAMSAVSWAKLEARRVVVEGA